jgi:hypothetical protein
MGQQHVPASLLGLIPLLLLLLLLRSHHPLYHHQAEHYTAVQHPQLLPELPGPS